jgi:hypothetical protein
MEERPRRKAIPMRTQRDACLIALGLDPTNVHFHHEPPLVCRPLNADGTDTDPPQLDPRHIIPMASQAHKARTPGDLKTGAKVKRLEKAEAAHRARLIEKAQPGFGAWLDDIIEERFPKPKRRKIPSRQFPSKGHRKINLRAKT